MRKINWSLEYPDERIIHQIVDRAMELYNAVQVDDDRTTCLMDITACHLNACPLDLQKLLDADDGNFAHDVLGIRRHINRNTAQLEDCFIPRCAKPQPN